MVRHLSLVAWQLRTRSNARCGKARDRALENERDKGVEKETEMERREIEDTESWNERDEGIEVEIKIEE